MLDNMKIAEFITERRKRKSLTQQQVADMLNVSFQAVSKWETGTSYPDIEKLKDLAQLLGVTVDELLDGQEHKHNKIGNGVFVVDDATIMRTMVRDILFKCGYVVMAEAGNGKQAVEIFNSSLSFDYVILDICMPEMNGIQALKNFRKGHNSKIIMLSALSQPSVVLESIEAGADYFVVKPFQQETLINSIVNISAKHFSREKLGKYTEYIGGSKYSNSGNEVLMSQSEIDEMINL